MIREYERREKRPPSLTIKVACLDVKMIPFSEFICKQKWTLAVTADLDNFSICGRAFYSLPNSAVTTNFNQKFDFTAHLGNNNQQGYWVTTHVQSFFVIKILLTRSNLSWFQKDFLV